MCKSRRQDDILPVVEKSSATVSGCVFMRLCEAIVARPAGRRKNRERIVKTKRIRQRLSEADLRR